MAAHAVCDLREVWNGCGHRADRSYLPEAPGYKHFVTHEGINPDHRRIAAMAANWIGLESLWEAQSDQDDLNSSALQSMPAPPTVLPADSYVDDSGAPRLRSAATCQTVNAVGKPTAKPVKKQPNKGQPNDPTNIYGGKSARIAENLWRQIPKLQTVADPCERRYLFTGKAGLGKTDMAEHLAAALSGDSFERVHARMSLNVEIINGQSMSIDKVREWQQHGHYKPMFGNCWVVIADEIDAASPQALMELRSYLDRLPLATTNKSVAELPETLQSRFKVMYFDPISDADMLAWLVDEYKLPAGYATQVIAGAKGNARAAKIDRPRVA